VNVLRLCNEVEVWEEVGRLGERSVSGRDVVMGRAPDRLAPGGEV